MKDLNTKEYLGDRSLNLLSFLLGISGQKCRTESVQDHQALSNAKASYMLCKTVESILNLTTSKNVLPVHMREGVVLHSIGGSALSLQILASGSPHASYYSIKGMLKKLGMVKDLTLGGDYIAVFDNNQTLRWKIQVENKVFVNVVTVLAFFQIDNDGSVLCQQEMRPGLWLLRTLNEQELTVVKEIDQRQDVKETHYEKHLYSYWSQIIAEVTQDQTLLDTEDGPVMQDSIDLAVASQQQEREYKKCYSCGQHDIAKNKITCPKCHKNLKISKQEYFGATNSCYVEKLRKYNRQQKSFRISVEEGPTQSARVSCQSMGADQDRVNTNQCSVKS